MEPQVTAGRLAQPRVTHKHDRVTARPSVDYTPLHHPFAILGAFISYGASAGDPWWALAGLIVGDFIGGIATAKKAGEQG